MSKQTHRLFIDQCQTNEHSLVSYRYQSEACNDQCQINGHDLSSYVSTRISYQCQQGHKLLIYQCQTNGHDLVSYQYRSETIVTFKAKPMDMLLNLHITTGNDYSLVLNSTESQSTDVFEV